MINCLVVGAGGFIGAVTRYLMGLLPFNTGSFPGHTFLINLLATFFMGVFAGIAIKYSLSNEMQLFLKTGFCGGFSTLSAVTLEANGLIANGKWGVMLLYLTLTMVVCLLGTGLGQNLIK